MSSKSFDVVRVNPAREELISLIGNAVEAACPPRTRERLVAMPSFEAIDNILATESGTYESDGGGVPNSYRQMATTSVLGIAWATDGMGRKHVRVYGARVSAPKSSHGHRSPSIFCTPSESELLVPFELIYPALRVNHRVKTYKGEDAGFVKAIAADPLDSSYRGIFADWLEEHGRQSEADHHRKAMALINSLFAAPVAI